MGTKKIVRGKTSDIKQNGGSPAFDQSFRWEKKKLSGDVAGGFEEKPLSHLNLGEQDGENRRFSQGKRGRRPKQGEDNNGYTDFTGNTSLTATKDEKDHISIQGKWKSQPAAKSLATSTK